MAAIKLAKSFGSIYIYQLCEFPMQVRDEIEIPTAIIELVSGIVTLSVNGGCGHNKNHLLMGSINRRFFWEFSKPYQPKRLPSSHYSIEILQFNNQT